MHAWLLGVRVYGLDLLRQVCVCVCLCGCDKALSHTIR